MCQHPAMQRNPRLQLGPVLEVSSAHLVNDLLTLGIVPSLLPMFKAAHGLTYAQTGLILFCCYLTTSVLQPVFGMLTDHRSQAWILPVSVLLTGAGLVGAGFATSFAGLLACVCVSGLGSGAFHPEAARCAYLAAGDARATSQAIFQFGGNVGQALGPLLVPLFLIGTGLHGLVWFIIPTTLAAALCGHLIPWYHRHARAEHARRAVLPGENNVVAMSILMTVTMLRSWTSVGVVVFLPFFYMNVWHLPLGRSLLYSFCFVCAGAIGTLLGGLVSDRIGYKRLLIGSLATAAPFLWFLPQARGVVAVVILVLLGLILYAPFSASVVFSQLLLPRRIGLASGLNIGFAIGAGGLAAALLGAAADRFGIEPVFHAMFVMPILGALVATLLPSDQTLMRRLNVRTAVPGEPRLVP